MVNIHLSADEAQHISLHAQLLDSNGSPDFAGNDILRIIDHLGYVQIDTIAVIQRAHHHTLWTRSGSYQEEMLHRLQSKERSVFEYWGHAMSYLPMNDFRYYLPKMEKFRKPKGKWVQQQLEKCHHLLEPVLDRVRAEGRLSAGDFEASGKKGGTWWDWKPAKVALEMLFWQGKLLVSERRNFQKIYDLTERVLPADIDTTKPDEQESARFMIQRSLQALGIATEMDISHFLQPGTSRDSDMQLAGRSAIRKALKNMVEAGDVLPVKIESDEKTTYYMHTKALEQTAPISSDKPQPYFLSPFDNFIIRRDRVKRLFGFDYTLECYLPAHRRTFGYFVLPVFRDGTFVARMDVKADRKKKIFQVVNLVFEPSFDAADALLPGLANKLAAFAHFNECTSVEIINVQPKKYNPMLTRACRAISSDINIDSK